MRGVSELVDGQFAGAPAVTPDEIVSRVNGDPFWKPAEPACGVCHWLVHEHVDEVLGCEAAQEFAAVHRETGQYWRQGAEPGEPHVSLVGPWPIMRFATRVLNALRTA
jgi:hypothetical protein